MESTHSLAHWIIIAGLLIAGVLLVIGMARAIRKPLSMRDDSRPDPESTPWFRIPLAIVLTVCAYLVVVDDTEAIRASIARERAAILAFVTQACPERQPGDADAIVITVHNYADGRPEDRRPTCARIPQRAYELKHPRFACAAGTAP